MFFYKIEQDLEEYSSLEDYEGDSIVVVDFKEMKRFIKEKKFDVHSVPNYKNAKCCKATVHKDSLTGVFSILSKNKKLERKTFGFILYKHQLIFIDGYSVVSACIKKIHKNKFHHGMKIGRFFYEFFETLIESDIRYLEEMGDRLTKMESAVANGQVTNFAVPMAEFRKEALMFYRYYTQLIDVATEFQENENEYFSKEDLELFKKFEIRAKQLQDETRYLREYSNQVRDAFRNQLEVRRDKKMSILTVVDAMFAPVTLLAGWYGMNFVSMPELQQPYAYPVFIAVSILIVSLVGWYLKRRNFW